MASILDLFNELYAKQMGGMSPQAMGAGAASAAMAPPMAAAPENPSMFGRFQNFLNAPKWGGFDRQQLGALALMTAGQPTVGGQLSTLGQGLMGMRSEGVEEDKLADLSKTLMTAGYSPAESEIARMGEIGTAGNVYMQRRKQEGEESERARRVEAARRIAGSAPGGIGPILEAAGGDVDPEKMMKEAATAYYKDPVRFVELLQAMPEAWRNEVFKQMGRGSGIAPMQGENWVER